MFTYNIYILTSKAIGYNPVSVKSVANILWLEWRQDVEYSFHYQNVKDIAEVLLEKDEDLLWRDSTKSVQFNYHIANGMN